MNVASLELCEELFRLSEWGHTSYYWNKDDQYVPGKQWRLQNGKIFPEDVPAYDLGYLLRKLQHNYVQIEYHSDMKRWSAYSPIEKNPGLSMPFADTPEDAACQLAIELFRQGILASQEPTQ